MEYLNDLDTSRLLLDIIFNKKKSINIQILANSKMSIFLNLCIFLFLFFFFYF